MRKVFGDFTITTTPENEFYVDYGVTRGSQYFSSSEAMVKALDKWSDDEIGVVSKRLSDMTKLRRYLKRI